LRSWCVQVVDGNPATNITHFATRLRPEYNWPTTAWLPAQTQARSA
jgi:hypothetical protein